MLNHVQLFYLTLANSRVEYKIAHIKLWGTFKGPLFLFLAGLRKYFNRYKYCGFLLDKLI